MLAILNNPAYAKLFSAQVIALTGTGLMTVALALLAYDLAGDAAGAVLGTALAIKMIAYVLLSPVANALSNRLPRKMMLIAADLVRAAIALALPFVSEIWHIYVLVFILQTASAAFTPAFQAIIPDILVDEADYTRALSLSRLAYDLENLLSPMLAGLLLTVASYHFLFAGTTAGFLASAVLVMATAVPPSGKSPNRPFTERLFRGSRIYLATPRLRGLLALNLAAASVGAFVIVNTVVIIRDGYALGETAVAIAFGAFGAGSMIAALALPFLLERTSDRTVMMPAGFVLAFSALMYALWLLVFGNLPLPFLLGLWLCFGLLYSSILTPSGRLLRVSAHAADRPAIFTAQFALSHACWLLTYPLAGWLGNAAGMETSILILGLLAFAGATVSRFVWREEERVIAHEHPELPADHPHFAAHPATGKRHRHAFVIDDEHRVWPTHG